MKDYIQGRAIEGDQRISPISFTAARVMGRKAGSLAGLPEMGYHAPRHAWASEQADRGMPLPATRDLLGHENISTTSKYLKALGRRG